ncbi:hypothetical protein KUCAC02_005306, partial [Chaenocephalus aceratus]
ERERAQRKSEYVMVWGVIVGALKGEHATHCGEPDCSGVIDQLPGVIPRYRAAETNAAPKIAPCVHVPPPSPPSTFHYRPTKAVDAVFFSCKPSCNVAPTPSTPLIVIV